MPELSPDILLSDTLEAFKTRFPMLGGMSTDFRATPLKLDTTYTAQIETLPTAATFDATTGYANGATSGRSLLVDLPITVDTHKHVPVKLEHLNAIKDHQQKYGRLVGNCGYVLGKTIVDSVIQKGFRNSAFTNTVTDTVANTDRDTLAAICEQMNTNEASPFGRVAMVSSSVMTSLFGDAEISSKDYYGQLAGANALRVLRNIEGFEAIYEYPGFAGEAAAQTFTAATSDICTATAHGLRTGDKVRLTTSNTLPAGLSLATTYFVIRLSADTFSLASTDALAVAGTAVDITGTGTGTHTVTGYENTTGIFFESRAIAVLAGLPNTTNELAQAFGIPQVMAFTPMTEPESGFSASLVRWQAAGTGDLYVSPASVWGSALGRQSSTADAITDKAAVRLITA
jgi:hypothetical protein